MRTAALLTLIGALVPTALADDARLEWKHDGHAQLPDAAAAAKRVGKPLLVGLAGSPT